ncbi:hypothetical protein CspeluHIS016_0201680 [Cutaneotrichosporon spelunceum]|uniref:Uncharacterized protein n=1 Tax=Cutaneotrichosporon spelunceum TaxID=1672016 RepID=A0AAD3TQR4_9TREE|nr:hypothetical protein CspeluHIS016_0201680 [Cutaneotrichosporon spelunceum]
MAATNADGPVPPSRPERIGVNNYVAWDPITLAARQRSATSIETFASKTNKLVADLVAQLDATNDQLDAANDRHAELRATNAQEISSLKHENELTKDLVAPYYNLVLPEVARVITTVLTGDKSLMRRGVTQFKVANTLKGYIKDLDTQAPAEWLLEFAGREEEAKEILRRLHSNACTRQAQLNRNRAADPRSDVLSLLKKHLFYISSITSPREALVTQRLLISAAAKPAVDCNTSQLTQHKERLSRELERWIKNGVLKEEDACCIYLYMYVCAKQPS